MQLKLKTKNVSEQGKLMKVRDCKVNEIFKLEMILEIMNRRLDERLLKGLISLR